MTLQTTADDVRQIEAEAAPSRFARGWHCLGLIRDFGDGKPHAINAFGKKLVVFRSGGRQDQRARRLLQAHGRRPLAGRGEGRRDRVPLPRLALGRRRPVQEGALQQAGAQAGPHRDVDHAGAGRDVVRVERPRGQAAAAGGDHSADRGRDQRRVDRLALVHHRRQHQLSRDHRQRRRHGALLLHPRLAADALQEHLRRTRRDAVHERQGSPGHRRTRRSRSCSEPRRWHRISDRRS